MARLIPRKQIEEQQNITGSLTIGQNVYVGNDAIISGSIFVSQSFFLGTNTGSLNEITGSVFLTGSLTIDGILRTAAPNTILSVTASNSVLAVDTQRYAGILAKDFGSNLPTLYVSSTDGDDTNDGRSIQYPLRTIKRAAALSTPGYDGRYGFDTGSIYNGYVIKVQAGTYLEDNPVVLPKNTTVWGAGLRITKINAKNPTEDLFWVNSGCYIAEVTMGGLRLYPDQINPEKGFGVAFQPGAFITTSPYVQNCSQISNQENSFTELYEDIPPGGGGLYVNGDVIDPDSPLASMVLDAYTQISPNGVGCLVNGRGFIQLVSFFNNFSYYAIRVNNGGHATLNNSNISFGLYGMYASGSRFISGSGGNTAARDSVRATWSVVVDVLNKGLEDGLPTVTKLNTDEGIRLTSPALYTQSRVSVGTTLSTTAAEEISADYKLISAIVENGTANFPKLLAQSSNKGYGFESPYNILGAEQITSSINATNTDLTNISGSYAALLSILANGTGSFTFKSNNENAIKVTSTQNYSLGTVSPYTASVSSSFGTILNILKNGLSVTPTLVTNSSSSLLIGTGSQYFTGVSSSISVRNSVSSSFGIVYGVLQNGTGSNILPIPENHQRVYTIVNSGSIGFKFDDENNSLNPTLTLFRGETYKFNVDATEDFGGVFYPFWIRTAQIADIGVTYDYNKGVVNNGDSTGTITFTVPYDAPNTLYYVADNNSVMGGKLNIVNSSATPRYLIANTLTYPETILSSSLASTNVDKINAYDLLLGNKELIKDEVVRFVNSSWSDLDYNQETCKRDVGYIIDGVAKDILYGGNEESLRSALYYYIYPSEATTIQKEPTTSAVKYAAGLVDKLLSNKVLQSADNDKLAVAESILDNREFIQNETIAFLSSSWSGGDGFYYNETKCKRDVGYILDAVATDTLYGGNERVITAAKFYYLYPSAANVAGVPSSTAQLEQTLTGIKYAAGVAVSLLKNKTFQTASASTQAAYSNLKANKELIQNETIEFINVAYPQLKYNQTKCRRDVGYIIDSVATDLLYGGNERGVVSGRNYYNYPSIATSIQRKETIGGIRYAKIIGDYIVQNIILETPRVVNNDEKNIKVTLLENLTSSISGTTNEEALISSSFSIVEGIIKGGLQVIPSVLAQNTNQNWGVANPLNVTSNIQTTNNYVTPNEINIIDRNFGIVTNIIDNGILIEPVLTSSLAGLIKVSDIAQISGSSATNAETASISASFATISNVLTNGLSVLPTFKQNTSASIKVTSTSLVSGTPATSAEATLISSSMVTIANIISGGLNVVPTLISNVQSHIKVSGETQTSTSGSLQDVNFISQSISVVTKIIETGNVDYPKSNYVSASNSLLVYNTLKANIPFIQAETIAYLSSSWAGFEYDEVKCKRDVGLIISGAAEDYLFNTVSASAVNGQYYYEYPSQATDTQLNQTLDGINYASRLAQQIIQNATFQNATANAVNAASLIVDNKVFIQNETIAYMSSSWGSFDYNEAKCRRDVGYIIDNVATDLIYGGNERTRQAGIYYFLYPSQATNTQLQQTTDAINYASRLAQKIVVGGTFTSANTNVLNASNLLAANRNLIANEVVAYVSSSWSGVFYNEDKCKRDVGYIIDAVRTDLVYGGNERTTIAGQYYYLFPSAATVGGVPSVTAQLDPTITGVNYASRLAQNIILNRTLVSPSQAILNARELVKENTTFIQQNVIDYISDTYPNLNYKVDKCFRDVRFIVDGVLTDLVYGGNERSLQSGEFYYKYPSQATDSQATETIDAINFAKELTKLIAIGGKAIEDGFDTVVNIISSGSAGYPTLVSNTLAGIKATNELQFVTESIVSSNDKLVVSSSFGNVINIVDKGVSVIPTIISSTNRGVNIIGDVQITSSITPSISNINKVGNEFDIVMSIIQNGTGSLPNVFTNTSSSIKVTNSTQFISTASISSTYITNANNSFNIVLDIVENGTGSLTPLVKNVSGLVKLTNTSQYSSSIAVSSSLAKAVTGSFDKIINIVENGTGSLGTVVLNGYSNVKVTNIQQYISASSATNSEVSAISASFALVSTIIQYGTGSIPTLYSSSASTNANVLVAYNILKNNISFIQSETIAYLSSSWSTASYDESKCRRDVGLIISGAMEDLLFSANSASAMSGKYYYLYPSQAQGSQLYQTLDGVKYASQLAQKVVVNTPLVQPTVQKQAAYDILINNKAFIQNETIAYVSSSWSSVYYDETKCKRDVGYIVDAVATDILYGGNQRTIDAGTFYYLYPSRATNKGVPSESNQLDQTVTGIGYARDLADKLLRGGIFTKVSQNKLQAKELIQNNKPFIQNEVIAFVSHSWSGFAYNEASCSRDVAYILDGVITDVVYGGNERSRQAGIFYYKHPSQATDKLTQLAPTLTGIRYSKGLTEGVLNNSIFASASLDNRIAYNLLVENKQLIQNETIEFVSSSWSMFNYNDVKCKRDVGYIVDAVATDILYGGNERAIEAGRYYYVYPSLATVEGDGNESGQLDQTLDGIRYAKGIAEKIIANTLLQTPTESEKAGYDLLINNKQLIQKETIAYISSSWSGIGSFSYNEASCSRDVAYILDNVATDLIYGGNERSSKAGEYYYLYPSKATVISSISPDTNSQKGPTIDGITFAAGIAQTILNNIELVEPTDYVKSAVSLLKKNKAFIQNETIQYIDAFFPYLTYLREKCRRDVGYIVDGVATDLFYGGNQRSITSGDYYFRYPNKATTSAQLLETVSGIEYAKGLSKKIAQNIVLTKPVIKDNTSANIKATDTNQYTSSINVSTTEISKISSSFSIVTDIIAGGVSVSPTKVLNTAGAIKVTNETPILSSINGGSIYADLVTSSFNLVRDIINYGEAGITDALARNYNYGFELSTPTLLHISSTEQSVIAGTNNVSDLVDISSSYATIINIVNNGTDSIPTIIENTSSSINVIGGTPYQAPLAGTNSDINKIGNGFGIVTDIIEGTYPTFLSNTTNGIKVTQTPQIILSGSKAERLQAKLVSSSFAVVTNIILNGTGSQTYVAPSATANTNPRITSAYNLLLGNKNMIIDETIAYMSSSWSTFEYTESKCRRDLGYIIDGAASDLLYGGNSGSFLNGQFYSIVPSEATGSQLDQTLTAIRYASGISEKVIKNEVLTHISASQSTSASYVSLIENKEFIQNEAIAYVSSSWSSFDYNEATCRRDVGYIVDAVATDLLYGGNERSFVAGDYYFRYPSQATTSQLQPTLDGINYAKGVAMNVAKNTTFVTADANTQFSYDILLANKEFIQNETIAFVNSKYPNLYYDQIKCKRDVGYIVDAVATDLLYGGNERAAIAGEFYFKYPSIATDVQLTETTAAIDYARRLSLEVIQNNIIDTPQIVSNTFNNIKVTNVPQYISASSATAYEVNRVSSSFSIVNTIIENELVATPTLVSNVSESIFVTSTPQISGIAATQTEADFISSSISIVTDIVINGTGSLPTTIPYTTPSTDPNVINAYNNLKANIPFIQAETIAYVSSSWSFFNYNEASCSRDVAYIVSGAAEDLLWNSNSASIQNGYYYFLFPSNATVIGDGDGIGQLGQTLDGINYASKLAQQIVLGTTFVSPSTERKVASELLKLNKSFIAAETVAYISSSWVTGSNSDVAFTYNDLSCSRDVNYILDNVATDILYGGNERTIKAGSYYFLFPSQATGSQIDETLEGIKYAGELAQKVVLNTVFTQPNVTASAVHTALKNNKPFIQTETIAFVSSSWSGLAYIESKCRRDVGLIIDAVATDILYGGNQRSATAGQYYFKYPSQATGSQLDSTLNAIDFAGGTAKNVITNVTYVTASQSVSASVELLRNNRLFIQNETMAYLTASWSSFEYNKDKCKRDVGYILDGVATDILYGGNERSVMSGDFYYKYPSKATLLGDGDGVGQLGQTLDGIIYASRISQKVAQNTQFVTASSAVSASFDLLRKNKNFIAAETIAYVSSSWSGVYYNEASCSRDVKYIIDAAATDVFYGGTERSVTAGSYYFLFPSKATVKGVPSEAAQLDPTITGVRYAGKLGSKIVTNPIFVSPSSSLLTTAQLLTSNKTLIQKETITFLSSSWSTLQYNETSCSRDLGFIIDAIRTDLVYGGNERSIEAGSYYYKIPSVAIYDSYTDNGTVGQKLQTVDGIDFARGLSEKVVANTLLTYLSPATKRRQAADRLRGSKDELKQRAIGYTNGAFPYLVYNEASCSRDTGLIVDACCTDLLYGGNERGIAAASSYYTGQYGSAIAVTRDQLLETLETNRYLRTRAEFIAAGAPVEAFGSLIVATGIDYSYNGSGVTFKALPPNQGGSGVANPLYEITELGGGRIYFTSGNETGDFRIGTGLSINQATGTLVGRTFSKSLFSLVTPFSLALQI
jgi:hypothetical protein